MFFAVLNLSLEHSKYQVKYEQKWRSTTIIEKILKANTVKLICL